MLHEIVPANAKIKLNESQFFTSTNYARKSTDNDARIRALSTKYNMNALDLDTDKYTKTTNYKVYRLKKIKKLSCFFHSD